MPSGWGHEVTDLGLGQQNTIYKNYVDILTYMCIYIYIYIGMGKWMCLFAYVYIIKYTYLYIYIYNKYMRPHAMELKLNELNRLHRLSTKQQELPKPRKPIRCEQPSHTNCTNHATHIDQNAQTQTTTTADEPRKQTAKHTWNEPNQADRATVSNTWAETSWIACRTKPATHETSKLRTIWPAQPHEPNQKTP